MVPMRRLRVVTESSVWLVEPDRYLRMPKSEEPRWPAGVEALDDLVWHEHVGVWLYTDVFGAHLGLMPAGRPEGSSGVHSGVIVAFG